MAPRMGQRITASAAAASIVGVRLAILIELSVGGGAAEHGSGRRYRDLVNGSTSCRRVHRRLTLAAELAGRSVLLIGDSIERITLNHICNTLASAERPYLPEVVLQNMGSSSYNYCTVPAGSRRSADVTIGSFMNYGVSREISLFKYAYINQTRRYGVPHGLQNTSREHIEHDATRFSDVLPRSQNGSSEPSLVVAQSYLWDLAQAYQNKHPFELHHDSHVPSQVDGWVHDVRSFLNLLHEAFPCSAIAWRTAPPAAGAGRSPALLAHMNVKVLRMIRHEFNSSVHVLDWAAVMRNKVPSRDYVDLCHPKRADLLAYGCMIFDMLFQHHQSRHHNPRCTERSHKRMSDSVLTQ